MDALRRAEAAATEAPRDDTQTALSDVVAQPASNTPLQLEPLETPGAPSKNSDDTAADLSTDQAATPPVEAGVSPEQARSVLAAFAVRKASARKQLVFVCSGLLSAAVILAVYYVWQSKVVANYQVASTVTLIDTPSPSNRVDMEPPAVAVPTADSAPPTSAANQPETPADEQPVHGEAPPDAPAAVPDDPAPQPQTYQIEIHRTSTSPRIPPDLQKAYQSYRQGDYVQAEEQYRRVLKSYPANRDAMLGLAAIALHQGDRRKAGYYYERLVKADPSDRTALLALESLSGGQYSSENGSKLKYWLESDKNNAQLHFALGNQYAASGEWKEAQQSYFEAHRLAPDNADYAFNMAVSLDQLGLKKQALSYYLQAQQLGARGGALFSASQLETRIRQLQSAGEHG
jgi:tetratricopeptide (TPR) repeat protein